MLSMYFISNWEESIYICIFKFFINVKDYIRGKKKTILGGQQEKSCEYLDIGTQPY